MGLENGSVIDTPAHVARREVPAQRWSPSVQREAVAGFRAQAGRVAGAVVAEVRRSVPEFAATFAGPAGGLLPSAVQAVILRGIDTLLAPGSAGDDWTEMFRGVGALAFAADCPASALPAAFAAGERAICARMRTYGQAHKVSDEAVTILTAAVARQVQRLCAVSIEGYGNARDNASDTLADRRARLLRMLLDERAPEQVIVQEAAAARWPVPSAVVAVALRCPDAPNLPKPLGAQVLADLDGPQPCLVLAADHVDRAALARSFPGWTVSIGPAVPINEVSGSLRIARKAIDLHERGLITGGPVVGCGENGLALALFSDDFLIDQLVTRRLAPLADLTPRQRSRMLVTLHEWLANRGRAGDVAEALGVHPQTVRYRMHQLESLFADQLNDPHARFELELAVRAELLRTAAACKEDETAEAC
ncbi:regulatory protein [Alloactinosynnema sp. L-07]|uniref:PucR family transcriptional regulator n=1 Tax=Alloactinosynnema sp. L-07 TaxID=1653480 RepID=UPI00065F0262|nr:PucR family transcriptional regulator [Alloactinosynnema sp. L-07]CRK58500.1 regulatory protein [Alloactinosynnema sp. L-07]